MIKHTIESIERLIFDLRVPTLNPAPTVSLVPHPPHQSRVSTSNALNTDQTSKSGTTIEGYDTNANA